MILLTSYHTNESDIITNKLLFLNCKSVISPLITVVNAIQSMHYRSSKENSIRLQICLPQMIPEFNANILRLQSCQRHHTITGQNPPAKVYYLFLQHHNRTKFPRQNLLLISSFPSNQDPD